MREHLREKKVETIGTERRSVQARKIKTRAKVLIIACGHRRNAGQWVHGKDLLPFVHQHLRAHVRACMWRLSKMPWFKKHKYVYSPICYTAEKGCRDMKVCVNGGSHSCRDNLRRTRSS